MDKNSLAVEIFNKYASEYQDKFMDVSLYADALDAFCDSLEKPDAKILELACGPGNITRYLLDKLPNLNILGTDLSAKMLELAKANNPEASFEIMDIRDMGKITDKYEGVVCGFCLPYLDQEEAGQFINDTIQVLNKNGVLYISTIEGNYSQSGLTTNSHGDSVYMYYYDEAFLRKALEKEMEIITVDYKSYEYNNATITDILVVAIKKS